MEDAWSGADALSLDGSELESRSDRLSGGVGLTKLVVAVGCEAVVGAVRDRAARATGMDKHAVLSSTALCRSRSAITLLGRAGREERVTHAVDATRRGPRARVRARGGGNV